MRGPLKVPMGTTQVGLATQRAPPGAGPGCICISHTCHNLPPSEIDGELFLAVFTGSEGRYLFHRIG